MSESVKAYILMGLKRCGKSTQGKMIADKIGVPYVDTDALVEQNMGMDARTIYAKKGVVAFTLAEQAVCESISQKYANQSVIVSAGSGICDNAPALYMLKNLGDFVFLNLDIEFCVSKVEKKITMNTKGEFENAPGYVLSKHPKNMQQVHEILMEKFSSRIDQYKNIADIVIDIRQDFPEQINEKIMRILY